MEEADKKNANPLRLDRCLTVFKYFDNSPLRENEEGHEDTLAEKAGYQMEQQF